MRCGEIFLKSYLQKIKQFIDEERDSIYLILIIILPMASMVLGKETLKYVFFMLSWTAEFVAICFGCIYLETIQYFFTTPKEKEKISIWEKLGNGIFNIIIYWILGHSLIYGILVYHADNHIGVKEKASIVAIDTTEKCSLVKTLSGYRWEVDIGENWTIQDCSQLPERFLENHKIDELPYTFEVIVYENIWGTVIKMGNDGKQF